MRHCHEDGDAIWFDARYIATGMHSNKVKPFGRSSAGTFPGGNFERKSSPTPPLLALTFMGHASTYSMSSLEMILGTISTRVELEYALVKLGDVETHRGPRGLGVPIQFSEAHRRERSLTEV